MEDFAVRAVGLFRYLQEQPDRAGWVIGKQFLRAATSVGANAEEAQDASSRKDFVQKYSIALREAREARYWLRLMKRTEMVPADRIEPLLTEAGEIYAILSAVVRNAKQNASS
ncbi:MAG: four helix bundle protein [Bacteroidota bacterium]